MAELLRMPEVAAGASSAVLSQWPTGAGASFSTGDVIAIIETDKAVVDVEAEADGTLVHLIATEGQEVTIGDPIALMAAPGENVGDIDAALDAQIFDPEKIESFRADPENFKAVYAASVVALGVVIGQAVVRWYKYNVWLPQPDSLEKTLDLIP